MRACYVDGRDISVGELLKCTLGFIGEKFVVLKCNGCLYIIQALTKLACHLERDKQDVATVAICAVGTILRVWEQD